ncbi:hypothetical protein LSTR_LSTR009366 [Laodelphax striatellus]|uniref:Uncharacterized protein n=2 Tax=Laodelphax striatellus TaxID=195883 RepID=A0A482WPT2_LAOST|nr:hypothetical protein LSTR_LSTR009366 [Laodelphax striatellus]
MAAESGQFHIFGGHSGTTARAILRSQRELEAVGTFGQDTEHEPPEPMSKLISSVPPDGIWEDNFFVFKGRGFWSSWAEMAQSAKITAGDNLSQIVATAFKCYCFQIIYQYVIEKLIHNFLPVCLMGPTGTGKSFYIDDLITTRLSLQKFEPSSMTFTVNTQPNLVQTVVLSKLIKRKRSVFGPPIGKQCLIFIDDMNMPAKEVYGAQPPLELLRMYFDHGYWFDLKDMNKIFVEDLFFVAAMGPAGGSRQEVYARFLRHFCLLSINLFPEASMTKIYSTLLVEAMRRKGFGVDFLNMFRATVTATINVYQKSILSLLPTPAKSHYTFNLRDISRVINGVMMFKKESYHDKPDFISLWLHEMLRVFSDRLVESNDRNWFFTQLKDSVKSNFRTTMEETLKEMKRAGDEVTEEDMTNLMFTSIFDLDNPDDKLYEQVVDMDPFTKIIQDNLDTYNHMHKTKIDIVLFRYALVHLSRILRLLSMPGGNGLLVGVAEFNEWRDDLKLVMKECGGRGHPMVFLFTENQIKHEYFLQDIDVLLNTGEVPNIFSLEETQEVLELARLGAQGGNRNLDVHPLSVLSYFRSQCRRNIHLMICFSPIGNSFRNRIRLYPAFVNCCTIDWFEDWPEDALEKVAERYFDSNKFNENIKSSLVNACKYFHVTTRHQAEEFFLNTGRKTYITSGSYLNLIRLYTNLFDVKQKEVLEAKMRYIIGLDSLQFAADQIAVMKEELEQLQPQLRGAAEAAEAMMAEIGAETVQVEAASRLVESEEVAAEAKAHHANLLKQECQVELAATLPILNEAVAALNTLKPNDITVVKAMKNPPKAVKLVMAAVCLMMGIKAARVPDPNNPGRMKMDFWIPSVRLLGNTNFLKNLKEYDKDNISPAIMSVIRKEYIPNKEFNPSVVKKASKAAEGLCKWVIAMEQYDEVIKIVAPKKERMEMAEEVYERTLQELNDKKALLRGFEEKLAALQERLKQTVSLKAQLTEEANMCWQKLQRAQQLIGGLGGEKERWTQAANSLQRAYENLAGDVLLSSAFIAYLGPFTTAYRHPLINDWKLKTGELSIPYSSDFDFIRSVGKDHVIQQWHLDGLPKDKFSVENGVMMASTNRYTFLIDPEGQANRWLKTMYMDSNMEVLKISDKQLMKKVETGILYGQPVLLEDVGEELDACLDPILLRTTFKQGGRDYITIGTKVIELHKDFNLFITTRLRCPHFLPEVLNKVTVINFALTKEALDDQLLAIAITILSPELEARRASMIVQSALNATALRNAEEDILKALSAPDKNVLEDENTIIILNESQKIAADIKEREKGTIETSDRISEFNKSFAQPVLYARSLYYCLTDLPNIDPMYHFSLPWFLRIYSGSLKADYDHFVEISNQPDAVRKNARFMPNMTFSLYSNVCRSLFEKDKLLFSFILCTNLMLTESKIRMEDLSFLLTGGVVLVNLIPNPAPNWILIRSWDELCRLSLLDGFQGLKEHVEKNLEEWRKYYDKAEPHLVPLPEPWNSKLTPFQKLLVLRIFHLDKMVPAIRNFVEQEMDECFVTPPLFDIAESYKDSNKVTPMIFILSPGVDPMSALQQFAEKMGYKEHEFESVSLGQGQGPIAENLIKKARLGGTWVCLQNCHLATSWMPTLEAICDDLVHSTKDGFRLWLTSYPSDKFPVPILQNGVKMTNEPPTGLKQNMLRTFMNEPITDQEFYNSCSAIGGKQFVFARLLFGLTFFHAVVLERKKYGPIGWNIPYGFNESDYNISVLQLQEYMMDSEEVPFEAVTYLTGECNYGGRVTDNWDRRALNTILASFVNARIAANEDYCMLDNFSELTINADRHEFEYYIGIIENISDVQPAEVVGLNSNASISRDFHSTKQLFEAMQLVQPKTRGGGSSKKEDEMVITITTDIQQKLPATFDVDLAVSRYPVSYSQSMHTVLVQEMERFNRLTGVVRASISMLQRAVRGAAVMTPDLEATFAAVLANRLPAAWARVSYPSLKPLAEYVADLIGRLRFLQDWYDKGIPSSFWLSGFFFTQAFLTAAMQNYARRHVIPIDLLTFDFVMTSLSSSDDVTHPPVDGVYVYGLFLEGARWDRQLAQLEEQQPKILFDIMPVIHFVPKQKKQTRDEGSEGRYVCPLYKTSERRGILSTTGHSTNYVLPLLLACSRTPAHWVKRGTALLCQLDN